MTATATKAELTAERAKLAEKLRNRQIMDEKFKARTAQVEARIAEIDAQLARPVLPEGWVDASEPPRAPCNYRNVEVILDNYTRLGTDAKRIAWFDSGLKSWHHVDTFNGVYPPIDGRVLCWREIPADWLTAQPAEADAGVATGKDGLQAEPTTERLVEWVNKIAMGMRPFAIGTPAICAAIRARILAADHSVDLRGVWEAIRENHKLGNHWPVKYRRSDGAEYSAIAYWDRDIMRWVTADTDLVSDDDVIAVLDPAALLPKIGGGE